MDDKFKQAISWAYHSEPDDEIRNSLGYKGDLETVKAVVELLNELGKAKQTKEHFDIIHHWSLQ